MRLSRVIVVVGTVMCAPISARAAGGAYAVDDAAIGAIGDCQVESWASFANSDHDVIVSQPACVVDLGIATEITVLVEGLRSDGKWSAIGGLQGKFIIVPVERDNIGIGLSFGSQYDFTLGSGVVSYVNVPVTIRINNQFRVNVNGGWSVDEMTDHNHVTWGGGFEWDLTKQLTLIGEMYGQTGHVDDHDPRTQFGLRYSPHSHIDCDLIFGDNITGEHAQWLTAGLTVRF